MPALVYAVNGSLLALDLLFFASTATKLLDGGWFPLLIAFVISFLMLTWRKGEEIMDAVRAGDPRAYLGLRRRACSAIRRSAFPGTAVVLGRMAKGVPLALSHNRQMQPRPARKRAAGRRDDDGDAARRRMKTASR